MLPEDKQGHLTIVFGKFVPDFFSAKQRTQNVNKLSSKAEIYFN